MDATNNIEIMLSEKPGSAPVVVEFPPPLAGFQSFFAWSVYKAGSTLLTRMLEDYLAAIKFPVLNVPGILFRSGLSSDIGKNEYKKILFQEGYAYVGWRNAAALKVELFDFGRVKNIFLVRDPRDRLVSSYFSIAHSHSIPAQGSLKGVMEAGRKSAIDLGNVNDWLRTFPKEFSSFLVSMDTFHETLPAESTRIYRYEDIIFRKEEFLQDIVVYAGLPNYSDHIRDVARKHDIRPLDERPDRHIRQVNSGNFRKHLSAESLEVVESKYRHYLEAYGYFESEKFGKQLVFAAEGKEARRVLSVDLLPG